MDGEPDIVAFGQRHRGARRARPGRIAIVLVASLLACLGVIAYLALLAARQDGTINALHGALRNARSPAPATTTVAVGSAMVALPGAAGGSFSVVAVAIRPGPDSAAHTWLFIYGRHADPGERYGLLEDTCGGQYVTASDLADGTADRHGDLMIVAPDLAISPRAADVWILVYRSRDGAPLGGLQGPLIGTGTRTFRTAPAC
jgi:hypothetical protein